VLLFEVVFLCFFFDFLLVLAAVDGAFFPFDFLTVLGDAGFFAAFSAFGLSAFGAELAASRTRPPWPQHEKCPTFGFEPSLHDILVACAESVEADSMSMPARKRLTRSDFMRTLVRASEPARSGRGATVKTIRPGPAIP
jgi:hypothetical protein